MTGARLRQNVPMRVVVATDRMGELSSADVGSAIATGWQRTAPETELAVVAMGEAGRGFGAAAADHILAEPAYVAGDGVFLVAAGATTLVISVERDLTHKDWVPQHSSADLGHLIAEEVRRHQPRHLVVDLGGLNTQDGGAGLLAGLGARADRPLDEGVEALSGVRDVDLAPVQLLLRDVSRVDVVVPAEQTDVPLLGLRGTTSLRGSAQGIDAPQMLAADTALAEFAAAVAPEAATLPGAGACGAAFGLVAAAGARVLSGPGWCADSVGFDTTLRQSQLALTATESFDFASRGGSVVQYLADVAQEALRPCVALAAEVLIGSREMRTMGIEAAYALGAPEVDRAALADLGARVARTWDR